MRVRNSLQILRKWFVRLVVFVIFYIAIFAAYRINAGGFPGIITRLFGSFSNVVSLELFTDAVKDSSQVSLEARYWDLIDNSSYGSRTPFMFNGTDLPHLWHFPPGNRTWKRNDDRVLAQIIFGMELPRIAKELGLELKNKTFGIGSYSSWYKNWKHGPHPLDQNECPGFPPELLEKCVMTQDQKSSLPFHYILESHGFRYPDHPTPIMASYLRNSDINTPYGKWVYRDPRVKTKTQRRNYAKEKTKMALAAISNCITSSGRGAYIRELQQYVQVDVYGGCGNLSCPRAPGEPCFKKLGKDYRFYLAFENSKCNEYVTEKLFNNAFENDMIPIVLGARKEDYKLMCPENSYIHVDDFQSPKELAEYMIQLANDPEAYNSYFRWKGTGMFINTLFFCRVCAMAHYADLRPDLNPETNPPVPWSLLASCSNSNRVSISIEI